MPAVVQKPIRLDQPIDHNAPPTIYSSSLKPELAEAALNLTIDFQRQKQSIANQRIFQHPYTILTVLVTVGSFAYYRVGWILQKGGLPLLKQNLGELMPVLIFLTMFTSTFFTIISKPTDFIKNSADDLVNSNKHVFGVDLKDLTLINTNSNKKEKKEILQKAENSSIVIYRDTPIAIVTIVELPELNKDNTLVVKITGLGVRKVYLKSGIIEDLFDWVKRRTVILNNGVNDKLLILVETLSCDYEFKKLLTAQQFTYIEKKDLNDSRILKFYGVRSEIWGLPLSLTKLSKQETLEKIQETKGSTGVSK